MSYPIPSRRPSLRVCLRLAAGLLAVTLCGASIGVSAARAETAIRDFPRADDGAQHLRRLVAIGDIHGAFNGVRAILREAALIDDLDQWVGGDAILVQTGDFLDRGPGAIDTARLLMALQRQAPESGGDVVVLLGNHEVLNLIGDLRDVTDEILEGFVDRHSAKRLEIGCNETVAAKRRLAQTQDLQPPKRRQLRSQCRVELRPGQIEYLEEMGPEGEIGRWLRGLPSAIRVGGVVFVHGGISRQASDFTLEQINAAIRGEIRVLDRARQQLLDLGLIVPTSRLVEVLTAARSVQQTGQESGAEVPPEISYLLEIDDWQMIRQDGPLWFRGYSRWTDEEGYEQLPSILESLAAEHVVVAHTPQKSKRITTRFDAQVFFIDTGMLTSVYKGTPSALEIRDGRFKALYIARETVLLDPNRAQEPGR